jgi:glycosyltransferase involved in cell wall biosynthesis
MNISFLTSGHEPYDDRIFYHMAKSLSDKDVNVEIVSSRCNLTEVTNGIKFNCFAGDDLPKRDKIKYFTDRLAVSKPDLIICSEPLTILASKRYSKRENRNIRIVYDITEWYPSKKNLKTTYWPFRWIVFIKLLVFNLWITRFADSFIFGEWFKSRSYRVLFPGKSYTFIPYYPDLKYIKFHYPELNPGIVRLSYSGKISMEKGYGNFFKVVEKLSELNKDLKIEIKIIGWYENMRDKKECKNLIRSEYPNISLEIYEKQNFNSFIEIISDTDIFLDLRSDDFENNYCLPIKLFYYAALGRPVIISDLKAIRKEVEITKFGFLIKPGNSESIARVILEYLNNDQIYYQHCSNARNMAENFYNWHKIEPEFIKFLSL